MNYSKKIFDYVAKHVMRGDDISEKAPSSVISELTPYIKAAIQWWSTYSVATDNPKTIANTAKMAHEKRGVWRYEKGKIWREGIDTAPFCEVCGHEVNSYLCTKCGANQNIERLWNSI